MGGGEANRRPDPLRRGFCPDPVSRPGSPRLSDRGRGRDGARHRTPFPSAGDAAPSIVARARIETEVRADRVALDPGRGFFGRAGRRRNLRWDPLDATYFTGYALWNYLNTPYLLAREDVRTREVEPWDVGGGRRRLAADFPPGLDTHSPAQVFYFDEAPLAPPRLRRRGRRRLGAARTCAPGTSRPVGWCSPTRRWVRPRGPGDRVLAGLDLVSLGISELEVG